MSNVEFFFKEFIESKKFKKLQSVNEISGIHINTGMSVWLMTAHHWGIQGNEDDIGLPNIINGMRNQRNTVVVIRTNSTMKDKRSEYLINQQYTVKVHEVLNYYDKWRDKKIQNILD